MVLKALAERSSTVGVGAPGGVVAEVLAILAMATAMAAAAAGATSGAWWATKKAVSLMMAARASVTADTSAAGEATAAVQMAVVMAVMHATGLAMSRWIYGGRSVLGARGYDEGLSGRLAGLLSRAEDLTLWRPDGPSRKRRQRF